MYFYIVGDQRSCWNIDGMITATAAQININVQYINKLYAGAGATPGDKGPHGERSHQSQQSLLLPPHPRFVHRAPIASPLPLRKGRQVEII